MNLLMDDVFRVITKEGQVRMSLPNLLEALGQDSVESLAGIQRHQADIFHIFLCYLAGAALVHSGRASPDQNFEFWRKALRGVVGRDDDCAWELVVEDPTKPAFMQPPAPSKEVFRKNYKLKSRSPDNLDVIQAAKNHDIKMTRALSSDVEAWVYALISLQTASGYFGKWNYGIARMNTGFGSRPCVSWQENRRAGSRFLRDTSVLMRIRQSLLSSPYQYTEMGKTYLWIDPWDGSTSLSLDSLDPFFTEVSRRVRMVKESNKFLAFAANSTCTRISAKELKGNIGDPWTPINIKESSGLTVVKSVFTPELLRNLIFKEKFQPAPMQLTTTEGGSGWFCVSVLVRGQGTTDGFHEAVIRIPEQARPVIFGSGAERDRLADLSMQGLDMVGTIQSKVLRRALYALMEGGPGTIDFKKREISLWVDKQAALDVQVWQTQYFEWLWSTLDEPDNFTALKPWFKKLKDMACTTLEESIQHSPSRKGRSYRAVASAESRFRRSLYDNFRKFMEG